MQKRNHFHRIQQKKYSRGSYRNPYFQAPKSNFKHLYYYGGGFVALFLFLVIYIYSYPIFALQRVEIRGLEPAANQQMNQEVHNYLNQSHFLFFHNTNRFLFSDVKFREHIAKSFAFDQLTISLKKRVLFITIKERTSDIIWKTNNETYLADLQGVITQKIDLQVSNHPLPLFVDKNNKPIAIGDHVLSEDQIKHILTFQKLLISEGISFTETQIDMQTGKWMGVVTTQGYKILFDPDTDLSSQLDRLKAILKDTLKDTSHLQYIDLRFGDHVYYK